VIDFARPWMLVGLLGALLPVAIHFLGRRRAPTVQFSALAFILARNPQRARAIRLRERALLALRIAACALVAIVLAKPLVPSLTSPSAAIAGSEPVALVVVVDDSMSMATRDARGKTRLDGARDRAVELLRLLPLGSMAAVVASGFPARALQRRATAELTAVAADVSRMKPHPRGDDAANALAIAQRLLVAAPLSDRRIVVLSDFQAPAWPPLAPRGELRSGIQLLGEAFSDGPASNTSIVNATASPAPERGPHHVRIAFGVKHEGTKAFAGHVTITAGEREVKRWLELAPGQTTERSIIVATAAETAAITLPDDDLLADNIAHVRLAGDDAISVALVDGSPRPVPREDEVFFAANALRLGAERAGSMSVTVLQLPDLANTDLSRFDVIVLANVTELATATVKTIEKRMEAGAGVLVTAGDGMPADEAAWHTRLLPWDVMGRRETAANTGRARATGKAAVQLATTGAAEALRDSLADDAIDALAKASTREHLLVVPSPTVGEDTVAQYADGAPALLVGRRGAGRVALWTTTLDLDWSDAALQPGFMPLILRVVEHLAGRGADASRGAVQVGATAVFDRHESAEKLAVHRINSDGPVVMELDATQQAPQRWHVRNLLEPGPYRVVEKGANAVWSDRPLAVVVDPRESVTSAVDDPARWQAPATRKDGQSRPPRAPGWPLALALLLAALAMESAVLWRNGRARPGDASETTPRTDLIARFGR